MIERIPESINTRLSCEIHFTKEYHEGILNGMDPVIKGDLTPVTIDNNGTVRKADLNEAWYSYSNKEWANSIILQNSYESLNAYGNIHGGATLSNDHVTLDGQDDYINLGLAGYNFGNQLTLSVSFTVNAFLNDTVQNILSNTESGGVGIYIAKNGGIIDNKYHLMVEFAQSVSYVHLWDDVEILLGQKYNVILKFDHATIQLYINGKMVKSITSVEEYKASIAPFLLGANPQVGPDSLFTSGPANINVYQAAIFNRAISEEEIAKMTEDIKITNSEGLLKYVDFTNKKGNEYEAKEVIPEDVIESYFVWIPKYRYQLFNLGNYKEVINLGNIPSSASVPNNNQEIKIKFGDYNTVNGYKECETPTTSNNGSCKIGDYMTHPAFKSFEGSTGFWVGKFETGYLGANSRVTAQVNQEETSKIIIKPNVYSWRSINISNAFTNSQKYQSTLDSHMMKNSEWGAVAYLTNSRFGRCNGVSCEEARINNLTSYITGSASNFEPTCGYTETNEECNHYESISQLGKDGEYSYNYYNSKSTVASTTGNYYGIYDMAGGSWEYVMGVMKGSSTTSLPASGRNKDNNSGFKGLYSSCKENDGTDSNCGSNTDGKNWPDAKYYDLYDYKTINNDYQRGHLGDAAKEFGPFYLVGWPKKDGTYHSRIAGSYNADLASSFVYSDNPWVIRGAACTDGAGAGVGAFGTNHGNASVDYSFRVILTPII